MRRGRKAAGLIEKTAELPKDEPLVSSAIFLKPPTEGASVMYIIMFARKMGPNGSEIAKRVANKLQYNLYGADVTGNTAGEMSFHEDNQVRTRRRHRMVPD